MNKAELIDEVQITLGEDCSKAHAERVVNAVLTAVAKGLREQGIVQLVGFGTFQVKDRKERQGRNPQTKEPMIIPASRSIGFRPGQKLKEGLVEAS